MSFGKTSCNVQTFVLQADPVVKAGTCSSTVSGFTVTNGTWHHITTVYNGSLMTFYQVLVEHRDDDICVGRHSHGFW